jgi:hypothetical protein
MEHVVHFMSEVRFPYRRDMADVVPQPMSDVYETEQIRRDWLRAVQSLMQTKRFGAEETWMTLATRYLASDRVSGYSHPTVTHTSML